MKLQRMAAGFLTGMALLCVLSPQPQLAATFIISNDDIVALTNAINTSNSNNQDDTIELAAIGNYSLTSALPQIGSDSGHKLTIQGGGSSIGPSTVMGTPNFRIFTIQSGANVAISNLTIFNGNPGSDGGAIYVNTQESAATVLTIDRCLFNGNKGYYGGAIFNDGYNDPSFPAHTATLIVTNSSFVQNTATQYGGAIWNASGGIVMNLANCYFSQNTAARSAGAVQHDGSTGTATGTITNCTFTQNSAGDYGGAINVDGQGGFDFFGNPTTGSALLTVTNCTFSQNSANWGGGIAIDGSNNGGTSGNATVKVDSCTFSGNSSGTLGDAIYLSETTSGTTLLQIGNSILASNEPDYNITTDNISGGSVTVISSGYNLSDDASCGVSPCNDPGTGPGGLLNHQGDQRNTDPLLDPAGLKDNFGPLITGGPLKTIALQSTSPALDHGNRNTIAINGVDQRGEPRPFDDPNVADAIGGDGSDIGAYEADVRAVDSGKIGSNFQIVFTNILGHTYEVQTRTSLNSGSWTTVNNTTPAPPISGTGGFILVTVPNAFSFSSGFYRLDQLP